MKTCRLVPVLFSLLALPSLAQEDEREAIDPLSTVERKTVAGTLVRPAGVPGDERVFAVLRGVRGADEDEDELWLWYGEEFEELDRAEIAADGTFELRVPVDLSFGTIDLDARYLYCEQPIELHFDENALGAREGALRSMPETVRLEALLGGVLRIRLEPSPGSELDPAVLIGRAVRLEYHEAAFDGAIVGTPPSVPSVVGEDLVIEIAGASPKNVYSLDARPSGFGGELGLSPFAPARADDLRVKPGESTEVRVPLPDGLVVSGRVVDEDGTPVEGAQVSIDWGEGNWSSADHVHTEADGGFAFTGVHPLLRAVRASAEGYLKAERERATLGSGRVLEGVELGLRRGLSLAGVVRLPDGRPVAGATVSALRSRGGISHFESGPSVRTGDDGRFTISGLEAGARRVVAKSAFDVAPAEQDGATARAAQSAWNLPEWRATVDEARPGGSELELVLAAPPGLRGVVSDDTGAPVTSFQLAASADRGQSADSVGWSGDHQGQFESADGRFAWDALPVGRWIVTAHATGYATSAPVRVELRGDDGEVRFVLVRGGSIAGRVVAPGGAPVGGARIEPVELRGNVAHYGHEHEAAADGSFDLAGLAPGRYRLVASVASGFAPSAPVELELGPGERRAAVDLALREGGRLELRVLDRAGEPLAYRSVWLERSVGWRDDGLESDAAGTLVVEDLAPGPIVANTHYDLPDGSYESVRTRVEIVAGATVRGVLGGPPDVAAVVRGRVTSAGEPIEGASVVAYLAASVQQPTARTAADGSFTLEVEVGGAVAFVVHAPGGRSVTFRESVPASGEHAVRFELPTAGLRGRVVAPGELDFWTRVLVRRERDAGVPWSGGDTSEVGVDGASGAWSCLHLEPGTYTVYAGIGPRYAMMADDSVQGGALRTGIVVRAGQIVDGIELELGRGGSIDGRVVDAEGRPAEAIVFVRTAAGVPLHTTGYATAQAGALSIGSLPPGELLLEAFADGRATAEPVRVTVRPGEATAAQLVVVPATTLLVRVEDAAAELAVSIRDARGLEHAHRRLPAGDRGVAWRAFGPLAPGAYTVAITAPDGRSASRAVTLAAAPELALELAVE